MMLSTQILHSFRRNVPNIGTFVRHGSSIPVILLNSVDNWGSAGEIVKVKRGFARNFLLPRKMAAYATPENRVKFQPLIENQKRVATAGIIADKTVAPTSAELAESITRVIGNAQVVITKGVNEHGLCYSAVIPADILSGMKAQFGNAFTTFPISAIDMSTQSVIKELGVYKIKCAGGLAEVEIRVEAEQGNK